MTCHYCGLLVLPGFGVVLRCQGCERSVACHWPCHFFWAHLCPVMEAEEMEDEGGPPDF